MHINKNIIISILIILLLILGWVYGKNQWRFDPNSTDNTSYDAFDGTDLSGDIDDLGNKKRSESYKQLFVDACIEEWQWDANNWTWGDDVIDFVEYCNCVADRLETKYTIPQFLQQMDSDPDLNFMFDEVWECLWQ